MIATPYPVEIIKSFARKSVGIQVYPDCTVKIRAPFWVSRKKIDEIILEKQAWINQKIEHFQQKKEASQPKLYIDGEIFYHLGAGHRLRIVDSKKNSVEVKNEEITIKKTAKRKVKNLLENWFQISAKEVFEERLKVNFEIFSRKFQYQFPDLKIKKMKARWGSMSRNGLMTLNSRLIHTPIECIDYVVMHELCHLKHQNHGREFHELQKYFTPNYKEIKKKLDGFNPEVLSMW